MKKYITAFFTILGYTTFLFLLGAGIVICIGYRKSQAAEAAVMSTGDGQTVSMLPAKQTDATTPSMSVQTLPELEPVSPRPRRVKEKGAPAPTRHVPPATPPAKPVAQVAAKTATYTVPTAAKPTIATPPKEKPKKTAPTTHAALGLPAESPRQYRATDNGANPRTGSRVPDVSAPPSELEQQAIRHARNIRQLEEETAKLRNPPVEETDLMKLFSGGK